MGVIKSGKGPLIGNSGEFFVVAELLRRGCIAALAPRNAPDIDILAMDNGEIVRIRVKTKSLKSEGWQWNLTKDGTIFRNTGENDFCILVDLKFPKERPDFYFFKANELEEMLRADFKRWAETPGKNGRAHDATTRKRVLWPKEHKVELEMRKNNWKFLGLCFEFE